MALLDNGAQVNTSMLRYVSDHSLEVGPITNLMGSKVACIGLGNAYTRPLGYVVIWVQVDRVQGYDKDQIALVIPDYSNFTARVPVILGMPAIGQVVNVMTEVKMDALVTPWANARAAHLLLVHRMMPIEVGNGQEEKFDANDDDPLMYTQKAETIEPFSSPIVPVKTGKVYVGECINVMVQALQTQDGSMPQGLTVQNTYPELRKGSKKAVVVVWNNTAYLQTLWKKTPMARAVAVSPKGEKLQEKAGKSHGSHTTGLTGKDMANYLTIGLKQPGFLDPRAGRHSLPAPGWIPWCVLIGSSRVGLYSFYRAYNKSNCQYPFQRKV